MRLLDFIFSDNQEKVADQEPPSGLLKQPSWKTILKIGNFEYSNRHVKILGFTECGKMHATLFLCHKGIGQCSEWGTLEFSKLSCTPEEEIWQSIVGKIAIVIHATLHGKTLSLKIEVDK